MNKILSRRIAKKNAWTAYSRYIRLRDCLATTGTPDNGICISCGREFIFKKLQAGHLVPGRYNAILFDEFLVNAQCWACNMILGGNGAEYYKTMVKRYGKARVDKKMLRKFDTIIYTLEDFVKIKEKYTKKANMLIKKYIL